MRKLTLVSLYARGKRHVRFVWANADTNGKVRLDVREVFSDVFASLPAGSTICIGF
ncbi:MAG: hypothetical protein GTO63_21505 [Anaerolineae bacterium]|nr:hypothetical protein [Anaerolineae bacterium]NIQ80283.1 hypothetical protein [Anaerolineae bacterium]